MVCEYAILGASPGSSHHFATQALSLLCFTSRKSAACVLHFAQCLCCGASLSIFGATLSPRSVSRLGSLFLRLIRLGSHFSVCILRHLMSHQRALSLLKLGFTQCAPCAIGSLCNARCSQAGRTDLRFPWSLRFDWGPTLFPRVLPLFCLAAYALCVLNQWLGACSCRWSTLLHCVPRLCQGTSASFLGVLRPQYVGAPFADFVFALECDPADGPVLYDAFQYCVGGFICQVRTWLSGACFSRLRCPFRPVWLHSVGWYLSILAIGHASASTSGLMMTAQSVSTGFIRVSQGVRSVS